MTWRRAPAGGRPSAPPRSATRCSRAIDPWWARTSSSPASSLRRWARRSARRRLLQKMIVERWLRTRSRIRGMDRRPDADARFRAGRRPARLLLERQRLAEAAQVLDGYDDLQLQRLASAGVDDRDAAALADATQEPGDRLERALRRRQPDPLGRARPASATSRSRRSRLRARCAPRFVPAIAWTSSTMTCSTPASMSRAWLVSSRYSDSGVVIRMSGGRRASWRRSSGGGVAGPRCRPPPAPAVPSGEPPRGRCPRAARAGFARRRR